MKKNSVSKSAIFVILIMTGLTYACQDDADNSGDSKIDPGTIADTNLIAYFPFDREQAGGAAVANSGSQIRFVRKVGEGTFVPGRRGQAYQGSTAPAYLEFDVISGSLISTIGEFTLACWLKTESATEGTSRIFGLNGGDPFMGNLALLQESQAQTDSLDLKLFMFDSSSPEWKAQEITAIRNEFSNGNWFHLVALYRNSTSTMEFYADGQLVFSEKRYAGPVSESGTQSELGDITLGSDISKIFFGAWPQQIAGTPEGWMTYYKGLIDEFRIYNKALSDEEVTRLYEAELSQVDDNPR